MSAGDDPSAGENPVGAVEAVITRVGDSRVAIVVARVAEVGRVPALTRVPGVPEWLAGVANWRGRLLPVLDLRLLLLARLAPVGPRSRLVVLAADGAAAAAGLVGVVVDAVDGTSGLGPVEPLPIGVTGGGRALLAGHVPHAAGPVAVLDVDAVVRLRDELPRRRRSA